MRKSIILNKGEDLVHVNGYMDENNEIHIYLDKEDKVHDLLSFTKEYSFVQQVFDKIKSELDLYGDYIHIDCDEDSLKAYIVSLMCVYNKTLKFSQSSRKSKLTIDISD
jgi:hypothetical protein